MATNGKTGYVMSRVPEQLAGNVDQHEERSRLTREALADVDSGRVIGHQAVQAWVDNLSANTALPVPR